MEQLLPLALTMMVGPQIITAILLTTAKDVVKPSLAYIGGVAFAATTGTLVLYTIASIFSLSKSDSDEPSQTALVIQTILVILLILASLRTYRRRATSSMPAWMGKLQTISPRDAFKTALSLIYLMPSDLAIMSTVAINLASNNSGVRLVPFIIATTLVAALPLLAYLVLRKKAILVMPKVRNWMEHNSWVVSIAAYSIFIWLLWP